MDVEPVSLPEIPKEFSEVFEVKNGKRIFKTLIGDKWVFGSGDKAPVISPIDESTIAYIKAVTPSDVDTAVIAANKAREAVRRLPVSRRVDILEKAAELIEENLDILRDILVVEAGKPIHEAEGEVKATAYRLRLVKQECGKLDDILIQGELAKGTEGKSAIVIREPLGVVAAITPFNYPVFTPVAKIAPAFLAGNTIVAKPSSDTPLSLLFLAKIFRDAGMPEGALNVVVGSGASVGDSLITHQLVRGITFTGSTEIGKHIARIAELKRLHLELGGKAPAVVLEDADLKLAAEKIIAGSFRYAGQRCDAISRILVPENLADELVDNMRKEAEKWTLGDPRRPETAVGPLINRRALDKVHRLVRDALDRGAKLIRGGKFESLYYEPTILDSVSLDSMIAWDEIFGPVAPVIRLKNREELIEVANKSRFGLDAAIFSKNVQDALRVARLIEAGEVTINDMPRHGVGLFPFGGVKDSGIGREGIGYSIEELTELKTIVFNV